MSMIIISFCLVIDIVHIDTAAIGIFITVRDKWNMIFFFWFWNEFVAMSNKILQKISWWKLNQCQTTGVNMNVYDVVISWFHFSFCPEIPCFVNKYFVYHFFVCCTVYFFNIQIIYLRAFLLFYFKTSLLLNVF